MILLLLPSVVAVVLGVLAALYLSGPLVVVLCATLMVLICFSGAKMRGCGTSDLSTMFFMVMPLSCMLIAMMFTGVGMILADHIKSSSSVPSIMGQP